MHLDCVFSILGDNVCLMLKDMMGKDSPTRRLVDEYTQDPVSGKWQLERERVEFEQYMRDNGFHIIEIAGADQLVRLLQQGLCYDCCQMCPGICKQSCMLLAKEQHWLHSDCCKWVPRELHVLILTELCCAVQLYACNILNMGDSKIISVHANTARQIVRHPHFHGDVQVVDFTPITSMYGAVHCSSQVQPPRQMPSCTLATRLLALHSPACKAQRRLKAAELALC